MIAFVGIDGSGKTSIIEGVGKRLKEDEIKFEVVYMGLGSSHYFKPLKWIMKLRAGSREKRTGGSAKKLRKQNYRKRGFFWVLGQFSELWLRYFHARKISKKKVVLFDRYFYDGLILSGDYTCKILSRFTPKPDKSFLITAPAKTIWKRKEEADVEDIKNYYNNAKRIEKYFNIKRIDNSKVLKSVVDKIYKEILK